ncbi:thiamine pyrophosphate-binding protein [Phocaeicola coprocola]|jgi:2-succinyl-5-enolpyruvyl-6-hydroxy-3-cyclohexene-1-carboxylate synthase|uniref:thiamine pyrophosphate-binding protein n=1 Tax=Phocaeicola coprocola TaxID=310298 RepID=UPI00242AB97C|nr:thiamine pyrophosphate-binding protein [Phocaeicola coprocola]
MNYTVEKNVQIVLSLLKQSNIRLVVASPGTSNVTLVASMQSDPFFKMYSSVDERSAAYMACGLAAETNEPVVLTCTGATASRNYLSALTEAFYRKLPILAITATQPEVKIGSYSPQAIDRSRIQKDVAVFQTYLRTVRSEEENNLVTLRMNQAIHALTKRGGGPVHVDLETHSTREFTVKTLPTAKKIKFYDYDSELPPIPKGRILIFVGNHNIWKQEEIELIDNFCSIYNGIVVCDHSSKYTGKYAVSASLFGQGYVPEGLNANLRIHIGHVSADYPGIEFARKTPIEWRVNEDGEIRNVMGGTDSVFEMKEVTFFKHYATHTGNQTEYLDACKKGYQEALNRIKDLPFSNIWIAQKLAPLLPKNSVLHTSILNSTRSWNLFEIDKSITTYCNTGGFGIDGILSTIIGASLANPNKLYYCIIGDLAFFYDMNSLGNRHIGKNLRILLVNNGCGTEFKNFNNIAAQFGDDGSPYIAAMGHYGFKSPTLVKHLAEDLGFKYLTANNKENFDVIYHDFINPEQDKSIIFEVFTNWQDESDALKAINNTKSLKQKMISNVGQLLSPDAKAKIKKILK